MQHNVKTMLRDVALTLMRRCINDMFLLGLVQLFNLLSCITPDRINLLSTRRMEFSLTAVVAILLVVKQSCS